MDELDPSLIPLFPDDPTVAGITGPFTLDSSENSSTLSDNQQVTGSTDGGWAGILSSLGSDALGIVGIETGKGVLNTGGVTYTPSTVGVSSAAINATSTLLIIGGILVVAFIAFKA